MNEPQPHTSKRKSWSRWLDALFWVAVIGFVGYKLWPQTAAAFGVGGERTAAGNVVVQTLEGDTVSLESLRGQVVLVNFWATWCPPCRAEMPGFQDVYEDKRGEGFTIVGLSTDPTGASTVEAFLRERGITYPVAMATTQSIQAFGAGRALPRSFLIDRQGRVRHQVTGIFTEVALRQAVERLLAEE